MSTNPQVGGQSEPKAGAFSEVAKKVMNAAGVETPPSAQGQEPVAQPTPKELEVELPGGVRRRVSVDDLVKSYVGREETAALKQTADARLAEVGDLEPFRKLRDRLAGMSRERRAKLFEDLQEDEPTAESVARSAFGDDSPSEAAGLPAGLAERLEQQDRLIRALAAEANHRLAGERTKTLGQRVDELMGQFSVFKDQGPAAEFAKDAIMRTVAANPNMEDAALEKQVSEAATKLQSFVTRQMKAQREEVGVPRELPREIREHLTATGLKNGTVRELATRLFRERAGS